MYIEQHFRRVREYKIMTKTIKLQQLDLIGQVFTVCSLLCNYKGLLNKTASVDEPGKFAPGASLAEMMWYTADGRMRS